LKLTRKEQISLMSELQTLLKLARFNIPGVSKDLIKRMEEFVLDYGKGKGLSLDELYYILRSSEIPF
jgi:hypothetical protein